MTRPWSSQHCTVWPPVAMTRFTKSSSLGGATPTVRPSQSIAAENQLLGSATETSGVQVSGPLKTTISPGSGSPNQYGTLLTSTRSPVHPAQPCSVCSIEPDGMKKAWTKKVLTTSARTKAIRSRTGSSRSSEPFFASRPLRERPDDVPAAAFSCRSPGSSPATTSAGPPPPPPPPRGALTAPRARPLLIGSNVGPGGPAATTAGRNRPISVSARDDVALLLDLGGLAAQLAEVVQLGAADVTAGHDLDLLDDRGVHREGALDADAEADLADGEGLADAAALTADDDALEDLDARAVALDHADVDLHGVPGAEVGDVVAQRVGVECVQGVHVGSPQS